MSNNIPEIRFKGFTHAWEQRTLGEAFKQTSTSVNPKEEDIELWSLTVENGLTPKTERYNREFLVKKEDAYKLVLTKEFIYNPMNMTLGAVDLNLTGKEVAVSGYYITMRTKEAYDDNYFSVWLKSPRAIKLYKLHATGGLLEKQRVQYSTFSEIQTLVPNFSEQTAIGNFFRTLDDTITLHKRKLEGLKELKLGYLQQMFPKVGESVPRVRFSGFTGDWKKRKFGEMVEKLKSYSLSRDVETKEETGYRYIHYGDIHKQVADLIVTDEQLPRIKISDYIPLNRGDLVLADASEDYTGIAEPSIILHEPQEKIIAGLHTIALRPQNTNALYLYYLLHTDTFKKYGCKAGTGLKVFGITFDNLSIFETTIPIVEEQIAIGYFFYNFDCIIEKQKIKLDRLKQLKSAYLQKMFV